MESISIIIPAYNEEERILPSLKMIATFIKERKDIKEVIIVDDGSTDNTARTARSFCDSHDKFRLLSYQPNRGKGYAVKQGMLSGEGDLLLFTDSDLSTPITELDKLLTYRPAYDVIIGSRALKESNITKHQPFYRELMGKTFNAIVQLLAVRGVKDTQCGFKLFTQKSARDVFSRQTIERWAFDVEVLFLARKRGHMIKEVPVTWTNDERSKVNPIKDSLKMLLEILRIRLNSLKGAYK